MKGLATRDYARSWPGRSYVKTYRSGIYSFVLGGGCSNTHSCDSIYIQHLFWVKIYVKGYMWNRSYVSVFFIQLKWQEVVNSSVIHYSYSKAVNSFSTEIWHELFTNSLWIVDKLLAIGMCRLALAVRKRKHTPSYLSTLKQFNTYRQARYTLLA